VLKVMSKMGISTLQSYRGAQIFEAVGLDRRARRPYFTWTASRIGGVGLDVIAEEVRRATPRLPAAAGPPAPTSSTAGGEYQWRRDGEYHLFNPETVFKLQHATRTGQYKTSRSTRARRRPEPRSSARCAGCSSFKPAARRCRSTRSSRSSEIVKRFATGAMSFGSISQEAHETLAIAMNRIGGKSNTGEGGEDPARYTRTPTATRAAARSSRSPRAASA
jgi:glutamate synthase (NADPH) large chain